MDKLKTWRKERDLNSESAGRLIGVTQAEWSRFETGARKVPLAKLPTISAVTGISARELRPDIFEVVQLIENVEAAR